MIQGWIDEAVAAGAQAEKACETVGLSVRTAVSVKTVVAFVDQSERPSMMAL